MLYSQGEWGECGWELGGGFAVCLHERALLVPIDYYYLVGLQGYCGSMEYVL